MPTVLLSFYHSWRDLPTPQDDFEFRKFKRIMKVYLRHDFYNSNKGIFLATIGRKIDGLVSYVLLNRLNQSFPEFWIPELVISKEYRGQGIGKTLIGISKRNKCYRIRLESRNDRLVHTIFTGMLNFNKLPLFSK